MFLFVKTDPISIPIRLFWIDHRSQDWKITWFIWNSQIEFLTSCILTNCIWVIRAKLDGVDEDFANDNSTTPSAASLGGWTPSKQLQNLLFGYTEPHFYPNREATLPNDDKHRSPCLEHWGPDQPVGRSSQIWPCNFTFVQAFFSIVNGKEEWCKSKICCSSICCRNIQRHKVSSSVPK